MMQAARQRARRPRSLSSGPERDPAAARAAELSEQLADAQPRGAPLEPSHRNALESRLGHDFSHVRIHADAAADGLARDLEARAFAVGDGVFFRAGEFEPDTRAGLQLLAHESAHTAQQSGADLTGVSLPPVDGGADAFEDEASRMGDAAIDASVPPPSALSAAPATQVQLWPWSDDEKPAEAGGGSLWDSVASGASTAAGYAGSGAKAAYDGYQKSTDFHGLAGELNKGVDWAEKSSAAGNQKMVDDSKGTWYEGLARGSAWMNNATTQATGGLIKGVGDLGLGLVGGLAHPIDAAVGQDGKGGLLGIAEHDLPFAGSVLKGAHGLVDLGLDAAGVHYGGQGQYGTSLGDLGNHLFNPMQQMKDDQAFNGNLAQGIVDPEKKGWQGFKDKPVETITRALTNIAPIALGVGEAAGAGEAGLANPVGVGEPPPTLRSPMLPEGVPGPGPSPSVPIVEPAMPGTPVPEPAPIPAGPKTLRSPGVEAPSLGDLPPDTIPDPPMGPKPARLPGEPLSAPPEPAIPQKPGGPPIPREEVPSGPVDTPREIPPDFVDPARLPELPEPQPITQDAPGSQGSGPETPRREVNLSALEGDGPPTRQYTAAERARLQALDDSIALQDAAGDFAEDPRVRQFKVNPDEARGLATDMKDAQLRRMRADRAPGEAPGIGDVSVEDFKGRSEQIGGYRGKDGTIRLNFENARELATPEGVAETTAHEVRHHVQRARGLNPENAIDPEAARVFNENLRPGNYHPPEGDFDLYEGQPVEVDARHAGDQFRKAIEELPAEQAGDLTPLEDQPPTPRIRR